MMSHRKIGLSILTGAGLNGSAQFFAPHGATNAARAATKLGFGLQLLPFGCLPGLTESFSSFLERLNPATVLSFEGRWGDADPWHAWRHWQRSDASISEVLAYYAIFPLRYSTVKRRCQLLHHHFPDAVAIDSPLEHTSNEVSPQTSNNPFYWTKLARQGTPLVLDTHHIDKPWWSGTGCSLLQELARLQARVSAVHVQIREEDKLCAFVRNASCRTESKLNLIAEMIKEHVPIIIELPPWLVTEERLVLMRTRIQSIVR